MPSPTAAVRVQLLHFIRALSTSAIPKVFHEVQMIIGLAIKQFRKKRGIKQEELAEKAGIDVRHLQRIENGEHLVTIPTLNRIAEAMSCMGWQIMQHANNATR